MDEANVVSERLFSVTIGPPGWKDEWQHWAKMRYYDEDLPWNRVHHYRMPRMAGVSTFLVKLANEMQEAGKNVVFLVPSRLHRAVVKDHLKDEVQLFTVNDPLEGLSPDVWIGDCVYDIVRAWIPKMPGKHIYIDSVD